MASTFGAAGISCASAAGEHVTGDVLSRLFASLTGRVASAVERIERPASRAAGTLFMTKIFEA